MFFKKKSKCPRCNGKKYVDREDIKRLKMELRWLPGQCAYCESSGLVSNRILQNVKVNNAYLTCDLTRDERNNVIRHKEYAESMSDKINKELDLFFNEVKFLSKKNLSPEEIQEFYLLNSNENASNKDLLEYINQIIFHEE